MPGIFLRTFGCKQNQFDSELLRRRISDHGGRLTPSLELADDIIINTCAVTQKALSKARGEISRLRKLNPQARISVVGCGARYRSAAFAGADQISRVSLPQLRYEVCEPERNLLGPHGLIPTGKSRGLLRIQTGCDESCAFCIVPKLRGPSRSVPLAECLAAQQELLAQGALEIILTGTNIALWGRDLPGSPGLLDLLKRLVAHIGPARLRLSSLEAPLLTPEFLEWCLREPKICRHFHLALQSASPRVLEHMGRGGLSPQLAAYIKAIARQHADVCIGADVIAGLPGETGADFWQTLTWIRELPLAYLHVFPYSEREGTRAAGLEPSVLPEERRRRAAAFRQLSIHLKRQFIFRNRHRKLEVMGMGCDPAGRSQGLTSNYLHLTFAKARDVAESSFAIELMNENIRSIRLQPSC